MINAYIFLQGKPGGKDPTGRPMRKWKIILKCILIK
jgi:hypothetical protein